MDEVMVVDRETGEVIEKRPLEEITNEILAYKNVVAASAIEVGKRLIEAKAQLNHGEWQTWLAEKVDFSEASAQRFMRLANEWSNPSTLTVLGTSKALKLLALEPVEREEFLAEKHTVNGVEKTVEEMSSRELDKAIKERDEARKSLEAANEKLKDAKSDLEDAEERAENFESALKTSKKELEAVNAKYKKALDDLVKASKAPTPKVEANTEEIEKLKGEIKDLQRKVATASSSNVAVFKLHFEQCQEAINGMAAIINSASGEEKAKLLKAFDALGPVMQTAVVR